MRKVSLIKILNSDFLRIGIIALFLSFISLFALILHVDWLFDTALSGSYTDSEYSSFMGDLLSPDLYHKTLVTTKTAKKDTVLELFESSAAREDVVNFFARLTNDKDIALSILENSWKNNIPPCLAFSLAWEESRYKPGAINRNADSIDRGLFQLNSKSFPDLTEKEFFNPEISAYYGLAHLNLCFDQGGNTVAALAMYNAGAGKVRGNNTPQRTLNYINRILTYRDNLENLFETTVAVKYTIDEEGNVSPVVK